MEWIGIVEDALVTRSLVASAVLSKQGYNVARRCKLQKKAPGALKIILSQAMLQRGDDRNGQ